MAVTTPADLGTQVAAVIHREARLLDTERLDEWLEMLTEDIECLLPVGSDTRPGRDELAMIREDLFKLQARVWRVRQTGLNHSQDPPSRVVRAVSNIEVHPGAGDEVAVDFVNVLFSWRAGGQRFEPLYTIPMRCEYRLRSVDGQWKIAYRQLNILQRDGTLPPMTFVI